MRNWIFTLLFLAITGTTTAADNSDPHYITPGFFDIHVCNWPDVPPFFMLVFSTLRYDDIAEVDVAYPDGRLLATMNLSRFRVFTTKTGKEKHAFLNQVGLPDSAPNGWYSAKVKLKSGGEFEARDYVIIHRMERAHDLSPNSGETAIPMPDRLRWAPIPGAQKYQVFIKDLWAGTTLYTSPLLDRPELVLPANLLQEGGWYSWKVHGRDTNEHLSLGDFNDGSLSAEASFTVIGD